MSLEDLVDQCKREKLAKAAAEADRKLREAEAEAQEEYAESLAQLKEMLNTARVPQALITALDFVRVEPARRIDRTYAAAVVSIHGKNVSISCSKAHLPAQVDPAFYVVAGDYSDHVLPEDLWEKICDRTAQV
jgi:uncharacterized membrane protein YqiK